MEQNVLPGVVGQSSGIAIGNQALMFLKGVELVNGAKTGRLLYVRAGAMPMVVIETTAGKALYYVQDAADPKIAEITENLKCAASAIGITTAELADAIRAGALG